MRTFSEREFTKPIIVFKGKEVRDQKMIEPNVKIEFIILLLEKNVINITMNQKTLNANKLFKTFGHFLILLIDGMNFQIAFLKPLVLLYQFINTMYASI